MSRMHLLVMVVGMVLAAGLSVQAVEEVLETGGVVFTEDQGRYILQAKEAKVNDVLQKVADVTGVAISLDEDDDSTISLNAAGTSLEKIIKQVSQGYAIIYAQDEATGEYRPERIVAAGDSDALATTDLDASKIVERIMERTKAIKRFHQNMVMTVQMMGNEMKMDGDMWMDGDKLYLEMTVPPMNNKQIIVSDGSTTYTYMPAMNMVQKMDMDLLKSELGDAFTPAMGGQGGGNSIDSFDGIKAGQMSYLGTDEMGGEKVYLLEGSLPAPTEEMRQMNPFLPDTARFWVSMKDGMPRRSAYFGKEGQEMFSQDFSNIEVNPEVDPSLFEFEPPEGVTVVDMTESVLNMHKGMTQTEAEIAP